MKKLLLLLTAIIPALSSGATTVDDAVNLTPYWDFNHQTEPIFFSVGVGSGVFNMPINWYSDNVLAEGSEIDASKGILSLLGGPYVGSSEPVRTEVNKSVHLLNLGGTAGTVWVLDYKGSDFRTECGFESRMEDRQSTQNVNNFAMEFIPNHESFANHDDMELRCRIEFNAYRKAGSAKAATEFFRATMMNFDNRPISTHTPSQGIKTTDFLDENDAYDPEKWLVYDFPFKASANPRYLQNLKIEMTSGTLLDATILIRSIKIYDPADVTDVPADVVTYRRYTVGAIIPAPIPEDAHKLELSQEDLRDNMTITFPVPAGHNLYYKVEHDPACTHPGHAAAAGNLNAAEGFTLVEGDAYVYQAPAAGHAEILTLMSEDISTGKTAEVSHRLASNALTGIEDVLHDDAAGRSRFYNLRGVEIDAETAAPGVYVERRGTSARKVIR